MWIGRRALAALAIALVLAVLPQAGRAQPAIRARRAVGERSPLGWPYSAFTEAVVDADGRLVFSGSSSSIFARSGGAIVQRLGAGQVLTDARRVAGVGPPALTA